MSLDSGPPVTGIEMASVSGAAVMSRSDDIEGSAAKGQWRASLWALFPIVLGNPACR